MLTNPLPSRHSAPKSDLLDGALFPERSQNRKRLLPDRLPQNRVRRIEALCFDYLLRDLIS
jgi:hypothetical protein